MKAANLTPKDMVMHMALTQEYIWTELTPGEDKKVRRESREGGREGGREGQSDAERHGHAHGINSRVHLDGADTGLGQEGDGGREGGRENEEHP